MLNFAGCLTLLGFFQLWNGPEKKSNWKYTSWLTDLNDINKLQKLTQQLIYRLIRARNYHRHARYSFFLCRPNSQTLHSNVKHCKIKVCCDESHIFASTNLEDNVGLVQQGNMWQTLPTPADWIWPTLEISLQRKVEKGDPHLNVIATSGKNTSYPIENTRRVIHQHT